MLRNLLLRVSSQPVRDKSRPNLKAESSSADWDELAGMVKRWFDVTIRRPRYEPTRDVSITVEYQQDSREYDIIAGGSGFHQTLTLLAFLFGYQPTTILLDEPDAHLHVKLQREILDYFRQKSQQLGTQFLIATHAEEFVRGVNVQQIVSLLNRVPTRIQATPPILKAMSDVSNEEITRLTVSPYILYVEGESDERLLRAWAPACDAEEALAKVCFKTMGGGGKRNMKERADQHFAALQQVVPNVARMMLFDMDEADDAFHPEDDNKVLVE